MALSVAVQVYSVRDYAEKDLRGTLQKIKDMGYAGVEFAGLYGNDPKEIKAMCEEIGLVPLSAHVPFADLRKDLDKMLEDYATIGCKFIAVPYLEPVDRPGAEGWEKTIADIQTIGKAAHDKGIQLLYHNHDFEFMTIDGKYALDILYDTVPAEYLATEIDTCWVNVGGENPSEYVRKYTGRAPIVHLKDFFGEKSDDMYELIGIDRKAKARPSNFEFRPVGSGLQDFPSILAASEDAGAGWVVVEQDKPSMGLTSLESIETSRKYLKSIGY
jgi:sugar phosphate isomerase/epimerase